MRVISIIIVTLLCVCAVNTYGNEGDKQIRLTAADTNLAAAANSFGLKLFHQLNESASGDANIFISPMSISYALAMTLNGADGTTRDAIALTLELAGMSEDDIDASNKQLMAYLTSADSSVTFDIANSIWYRSGLPIRDEFVATNETYFNAQVQGIDFGAPDAANVINSWVRKNTKDKITQIVSPPIDPQTIMFLINAIYFKGSWSAKFDKAATRDHPFYLIDGSSTDCRMMFMERKYAYFENDLFQAVRLPYGDSAFSMLVFLPRDTAGINALIGDLDDDAWMQWRKNFYVTKVNFGLPRLKFEYSVTLNDILKNMGMALAFAPRDADFGRMVHLDQLGGENVFISDVKHKTFLQVDEEGTEAAAVTSVTMALTSAAPMPSPVMIVDHPFLFAIEDRASGSLIFIGKVMKPVWTE
jgi:serine protease inhibitor